MTTNVTNVEGLRFSIYDEATPNLDKLSSKLGAVQHAAERSVSRVKEWGKGMAIGALGAVGLGYGLQSVYEKAKDANLELEDATKKIAGVGFAFTHWQKGTSAVEKWNTSMEMAEDTTSKLAETEGRLKIGRMELAEIYASATQVGQRHNLNQEQMIALTEKLGATEKVLGTNAQYAALMITRASMTGTIMGRDKFGMMLKGAVGDLKAFHKMSEPKRFEAILKAMGDLVPAAEAMGTGMRGALFDIRKSVEQILRDFTKPLFGEQTKSLREFAKHVTEIQKDGKSIATVWGEKLVKAFHILQDATKFIAAHWKEIAIIWGSAKMVGLVGMLSKGGIGGLLGGAAAGGAGEGVATGFLGIASKASMVIGGLVGFKLALDAGAKALDAWQDKAIEKESRFGKGGIMEGLGGKAAEDLRQYHIMLRQQGEGARSAAEVATLAKNTLAEVRGAFGSDVIGKRGEVNVELAKAAWTEMSGMAKVRMLEGFGMKDIHRDLSPEKFAEIFVAAIGALSGAGKKKMPVTPGGPPVNNFYGGVHITQEFKEADPDRVFHKVIRDVNDAAMNRRDSMMGVLATNPGGAG